MKLYMKLILGILGLLMATANYAQVVPYANVIDATGISDDQPRGYWPPTSVTGTNDTAGSGHFLTDLGHWNYMVNMSRKFEIEGVDSFTDNWLDAVNTCARKGNGWRLSTIADFLLVTMLKKELEQYSYDFTPLRKGDVAQLPSSPGEKGWHYWLATEVPNTEDGSYMIAFGDFGSFPNPNNTNLSNDGGKAGILNLAGDKIMMPFRCVRDFD